MEIDQMKKSIKPQVGVAAWSKFFVWVVLWGIPIWGEAAAPEIESEIKSGGLLIRFWGEANTFYQVQRTTELMEWSDVGIGVTGGEGFIVNTYPIEADKDEFYRVIIAEKEAVWAPVWADEFDVDGRPSTRNWKIMTGDGCQFGICGWGNEELQYYTTRTKNVEVRNGRLYLTAHRESFGGASYTSGRIRSEGRQEFTYGRFEIRAKLPAGQGYWPAIWMLPTDWNAYGGGWPFSGEIDIMEYTGDQTDRVFMSLHYGNHVINQGEYVLPSGSFDRKFTVFALEWEPDEIRWYIDGKQVQNRSRWFTIDRNRRIPQPAPFDRDFHFLLNVAVGGTVPGNPDATTRFPRSMEVDYVRAYERAQSQ